MHGHEWVFTPIRFVFVAEFTSFRETAAEYLEIFGEKAVVESMNLKK